MIDHSYISSDLSETSLLRSNRKILDALLSDWTTLKNIRWGTDNYSYLGSDYSEDKEIKVDLITGWHDGLIQPRADKANEVQLERTRNRAEVFTPSWIVEKQVNAVMDELWNLPLEKFLSTCWLEITCGEAPYMVNRYDMISGQIIPLNERAGFIDVKFRRLNTEIEDQDQWLKLAIIIYQSSYGYEYQGDSLLLARENLLLTFMDNFFYMFGSVPSDEILYQITEIISMNVFQMDGLTYQIPYSDDGRESVQLSLFEEIEEGSKEPKMAQIYLWHKKQTINFKDLTGGSSEMKFDVVIGNPPYQKEGSGTMARDEPMYNKFMDASFEIGEKVTLITPARFLFNAGQTPKVWNNKMLKDPHFKVLYYERNSAKVFNETDIKGGVAITLHDKSKVLGPILTFSEFEELNQILGKIYKEDNKPLNELLYSKSSYKFNEKLYESFPILNHKISKNERKSISSNIINKAPMIFSDDKISESDIRVLLREENTRKLKWVNSVFIESHENLYKYKVILPATNGSGRFGETLSNPEVFGPGILHSQTFISLGSFNTYFEAQNLLNYLKTKFLRALLGSLKVTQHNQTKEVWSNIPLQDFTANSDIDWSKSVAEIDQQLYAKYGLNEEEINFIETNVKEMV